MNIAEEEEGFEQESTIIRDGPIWDIAQDLIYDSEMCWYNMKDFRERRARNAKFRKGDQWTDLVPDPDNEDATNTTKYVTEETLILRSGRTPMVNNQIQQVVKNMIGQYRMNDYDPRVMATKREHQETSEMMTNTLRFIQGINNTTNNDARMWEEFIISGVSISKEIYEWKDSFDRKHPDSEEVHPARWFINTDIEKRDGSDVVLVGEILDVQMDELITLFANMNQATKDDLFDIYHDQVYDRAYFESRFDRDKIDQLDFLIPHDKTKARIFEIWRRELREKLICHDWAKGTQYEHDNENIEEAMADVDQTNAMRIEEGIQFGLPIDQIKMITCERKEVLIWMFYYLSPHGDVLDYGETPYDHGKHPYTMLLYPLFDGDIWSFVEDIIPQQKMINRTIGILDLTLGTSAKGLLAIPAGIIPAGMSETDFAKKWSKPAGVMVYEPRTDLPNGGIPQQINSAASPVGATNLLQIQLGLLKEISGINDAIQGQAPSSGTSGKLYAQQTTNSTISTRDYFDVFFDWKRRRDLRLVQLAQQYYDEEVFVNVTGKDYNPNSDIYNPMIAKEAKYDIVIAKSPQSPIYRVEIEQQLNNMLNAGQIDIHQFLENSNLPFSDKLGEMVKEREERLRQNGIDPDMIPLQQPARNPQAAQQKPIGLQ
jgi:hypothetical protein